VASDILGVSGRAMLTALVKGTRDPEVLAELARGQLRKKIPALQGALAGRFGPHHALIVGTILSKLEFLEEAISHLSAEVEAAIAPFAEQVELLCTIPGVDRRTAEALIAEIGVDMSRFGSAARLASWAGMCPGNDESAGKHRSGKTRKGSKWLRTALVEGAKGAARSKGTYLAAQHARLKGRRGSRKATIAAGHSILVAAYHMLNAGVPYHDLGADHFIRHDPKLHAARLVRQLQAIGYRVTLEEVEAA
jgi:transposase